LPTGRRPGLARRPGRGIVWKTLKELGVIVRESSFLTAKTSAMVCWLFVGSAIFSAAFALLGGQEVVEKWVLSLGLTPLQFMILAQFIIFILGWPLEWTEIIIIFMPIFIRCCRSSASTRCSSGCWWRSTCRPRSSRRRWRWPRST
jgi:hypothetical protein